MYILSYFDWHVCMYVPVPVCVTCVHWMCNVAQSFTHTLSCAQVPRERRRAKCALLAQCTVIPHHPPWAHWHSDNCMPRGERDNPVSMWTTSGYHLGRASVKFVFIENCQMVICKYLCKMFWKLCNSIYRNIVKSLLHITFQTFPSTFKRRRAFLDTW